MRYFFSTVFLIFATVFFSNLSSEIKPKREIMVKIFDEKTTDIILHENASPKQDGPGVIYNGKTIKLKGNRDAKVIALANYGFEGDIVSFKIVTNDNITGWADPNNIWIPVQVINVRFDDVLNIRQGESHKTRILDRVPPGGILYVNWEDYYSKTAYIGVDRQWLRVYTQNRILGYTRANFLNLRGMP